MFKLFPGGVHPKENKGYTENKAIKQARLPLKVTIPMIQHTGAPCEPIVKVGEPVKKGQAIGRAEKFITSPVHASISGAVKEIDVTPHPTAGKALSVVIESDGKDEWSEHAKVRDSAKALSKDEIIDIVQASGIVGMGGAAFPTHVKLKPPKKVDTLILNGAECEPYLTCDNRLMIEKPQDILKGLHLIMKAVEVNKAIIAIESNKPEAAKAMENALDTFDGGASGKKNISIKVLPARYPQGSEKQIIYALLKRKVPPKALPFEVGCVVQNVGTALAVSEAVYHRRPLIERCITLSGDCVQEPQNLSVRIGTSVRDLLDECGGLKGDPVKVIFGGPMMGIAQYTLDIPVIKGMSGILFLSDREARIFDESPCIRCGKCVNACPMSLLPLMYAKFVKKDKWDKIEKYNIDDCMECGACSYVCPSKIPIIQYIKVGKSELFRQKKGL
ncbi:MAG: electron transport complex subunit RsxC [Candidatus Omnitrophica bacterium]|nr:electron transport complex subunit RsxC [Candidatus Omnitrophota bacterium]